MVLTERERLHAEFLETNHETPDAIVDEHADERDIETLHDGLIGRDGTTIGAIVVTRREAVDVKRRVGDDASRRYVALGEHGGKKERLEEAAGATIGTDHVDLRRGRRHGGVADIGEDTTGADIGDEDTNVIDIFGAVAGGIRVGDGLHMSLECRVDRGCDIASLVLTRDIGEQVRCRVGEWERRVGERFEECELIVIIRQRAVIVEQG